jgi:hypothetical protein
MSFSDQNGSNSTMCIIILKGQSHIKIKHTEFCKVLKVTAKTSVAWTEIKTKQSQWKKRHWWMERETQENLQDDDYQNKSDEK